MTDQQIRERCKVLRNRSDAYDGDYMKQDVLESLYREAMAAGLEMAARSMEAMLDVPGSTDDQAWAHVGWCRAEAQRVKEAK